jgi:hypothetical protein
LTCLIRGMETDDPCMARVTNIYTILPAEPRFNISFFVTTPPTYKRLWPEGSKAFIASRNNDLQ